MTLDTGLVDLIDQRIRAHARVSMAMGTVIESNPGDLPKVTFDGSSIAAPVSVFDNVGARIGDRVGLIQFNADWIIVGTFGTSISKGCVQSKILPSFTISNSTTQVLHDSIPAYLYAGRKYLALHMGRIVGDTNNDNWLLSLRRALGSTVLASDTLIGRSKGVAVIGDSRPISTAGFIDVTTSGLYTIGIFVSRASGTGTVTVDAPSEQIPMLLALDIGRTLLEQEQDTLELW